MSRTIWLVSDTHFGHHNIIQYCNRPFGSVEEMNAHLVAEWNKVVKPHDKVYHLGDFVINKKHIHIGKMLNGKKRLVIGNHDPLHSNLQDYLDAGFEAFYGSVEKFKGLVLSHIPVHPNSIRRWGSCVHGHIHDKSLTDNRYVNVCVEATGYRPLSLEEVYEKAERQRQDEQELESGWL